MPSVWGKFVSVCRRQWRQSAILVLTAVLLALCISSVRDPVYKSTVTLEIAGARKFAGATANISVGREGAKLQASLLQQAALAKSEALAFSIVEMRQLDQRNDFLGSNIEELRPPRLSDFDWQDKKKAIAASMLTEQLEADLEPDRTQLRLTYSSHDPVLASEIAEAYGSALSALGRFNSGANLDEIQERIEDAQKAIGQIENELSSIYENERTFFERYGHTNEDITTTFNHEEIARRLRERLSVAGAERASAEQNLRSLEDATPTELASRLSTASLAELDLKRTEKEAEARTLSQRFNAEYPPLIKLRAEVEELNKKIENRVRSLLSKSRNLVLERREIERRLLDDLAALPALTEELQGNEAVRAKLERDLDARIQQVMSLVDGADPSGASTTDQAMFLTVVKNATVPNAPSKPNLRDLLYWILPFALLSAALLSAAQEIFVRRIDSTRELARALKIPVLGSSPFVVSSSAKPNKMEMFVDDYAAIFAKVIALAHGEPITCQITSTSRGEGVSTTALMFAGSAAQAGHKTLLIDSNLRYPSLSARLGLRSGMLGLADVVVSGIPLKEVLQVEVRPNLDFLPPGELQENPVSILSSNAFRESIIQLQSDYSIIVLDTGPILGLADFEPISRSVDNILFVLEAHTIAASDARTALKRIGISRRKVLGAILTKWRGG